MYKLPQKIFYQKNSKHKDEGCKMSNYQFSKKVKTNKDVIFLISNSESKIRTKFFKKGDKDNTPLVTSNFKIGRVIN